MKEIEFAPQDCISGHQRLADEFVYRIFEIEGAWLSDESSIWDFHFDEDDSVILSKIREIYGVDVSDIRSGNLCEIFNRIKAHREHPKA